MSNGSVQFISKVPGNRTLDVDNFVLQTGTLDEVIDREEFLLRKFCLPRRTVLDRTGETTVYT